LQDVPLELRVVDQDIYSSELVGTAYLDLAPLLMRQSIAHTLAPFNPLGTALSTSSTDVGDDFPLGAEAAFAADGSGAGDLSPSEEGGKALRGWLPLFDTLKGLRGSLYVTVKVQRLGGDGKEDKLAESCVQFFSASKLSTKSFFIRDVLGLVTDLILEPDPESSWHDFFRRAGQASKAANDSRQKVLYELSASVRRGLARKTLEMGGNAVLGFRVQLDLEGSSGLVVRGTGTACSLLAVTPNPIAGTGWEGGSAWGGAGAGGGAGYVAGLGSDGSSDCSDYETDPSAILVQGPEAMCFLADYYLHPRWLQVATALVPPVSAFAQPPLHRHGSHGSLLHTSLSGSAAFSQGLVGLQLGVGLSAEERADLVVLLPRGLGGLLPASAGNVSAGSASSSSNAAVGNMYYSGAVLLRTYGPRIPEATGRQQQHRHHKKEHFRHVLRCIVVCLGLLVTCVYSMCPS